MAEQIHALWVWLAGKDWRGVGRTDAEASRGAKANYAEQLSYIAQEAYLQEEYIRLVEDTPNTGTRSAHYEVFAHVQARQLASRFEALYTPTYGCWLNMSEIERDQRLRAKLPHMACE